MSVAMGGFKGARRNGYMYFVHFCVFSRENLFGGWGGSGVLGFLRVLYSYTLAVRFCRGLALGVAVELLHGPTHLAHCAMILFLEAWVGCVRRA